MKKFVFLSLFLIQSYCLAAANHSDPNVMDAKEDFLKRFDIHDSGLSFKRLGGTTATNWMVKQNGVPVANLKCTGGNTNYTAAIAAYQLGRILDFNIYPVAVEVELENRNINGKSYSRKCALKEWSSNFTQYYWTRDTFVSAPTKDKRNLIAALKGSGHINLNQSFTLYAYSRFGFPKVNGKTGYYGHTSLLVAAKDWSNMMVVDAIIGNNDRFPGGNTFFRSESNDSNINDARNRITFDNARIFSLDNEASLRGRSSNGMIDLKRYISRFDRDFIEKLREFRSQLNYSSAVHEYPFLGYRALKTNEGLISLFKRNIDEILEHVENQENKYGNSAYFN